MDFMPFNAGGRSRQVSADISEAAEVLDRTMRVMNYDKFCNILMGFQYEVNKRELRIDDIFVTNFNTHQFMEPKDYAAFTEEKKQSFAEAIIYELETIQKREISQISRQKDTAKLVQAFSRLMVDFNLNITKREDFIYYFDTLCGLIKLDLENDEPSSPEEHQVARAVLKIVQHIVKKRLGNQVGDLNHLHREDMRFAALPQEQDEDQHCNYLLGSENKALRKLIMDVLEQRGSSKECIELKQRVIGMLVDVIRLGEYIIPLFLEQGILVFLLQILFDSKISVEDNIQEKNRKLDGLRTGMLQGLIPDIQAVVEVDQDDYQNDVVYQHYSRQTILDIILKVELKDKKSPVENMLWKQGNDQNYEQAVWPQDFLKAFLPQNFLLEILDKMKEDAENQVEIDQMQKNWLRSFDQK